MSFYEFYLLVKRDVIPILVLKNPWMTNSGAPNHHPVTSCVSFYFLYVFHAFYVTIANDRYLYGLFDLCNCIPIGLAEKELRSCATVYGNECGAIVFKNLGYFQIIA